MYWKKKFLKYNILIPLNVKAFEEFTKEETEEYFSWYVKKIPERVQYLSTYSGVLLDFSVNSLVDIWAWFIKSAEIEKTPQIRIKELKEQLKGQPKEITDASLRENREQLTLETMYIARDIAMYYGEVFVRNNKPLYWGYHTDINKDSFANRPLIMGFEDRDYSPPFQFNIDPVFFVEGYAGGVLFNDTYPTELIEGYKKMQKNVHNP